MGREKLKVGLCNRMPLLDASEHTDGDRGNDDGIVAGEFVAVDKALPARGLYGENRLAPWRALASSSELSTDMSDRELSGGPVKGDRGGAEPL